MKNKYIFKEEDITTDVLFKIEQISSILAEKENLSFDDAYEAFVSSNTYKILKRNDNLYWAESAEFLVDEYYRELQAHTGNLPFNPSLRLSSRLSQNTSVEKGR